MTSPTVEDYLKQIWMLREGLGCERIPMGELARSLSVSPGTVTTMVKSISEAGLADYIPRLGVGLSPEGEAVALRMVRRHRLVECFLVEVLGMDWSEVHAEAEVLEHAVSDTVVERMAALMGDPAHDPHGNPIPARDGSIAGAGTLRPLSECVPGASVVVARVRQQPREVLDFLSGCGLKPGSGVEV
ncbi:MAG TPA: metal-dependent transcriptional regulator, partial [Bacteroidia bacterium]|nr:metal-dependent transcriptional regulator [Bacteroidia bacterium]